MEFLATAAPTHNARPTASSVSAAAANAVTINGKDDGAPQATEVDAIADEADVLPSFTTQEAPTTGGPGSRNPRAYDTADEADALPSFTTQEAPTTGGPGSRNPRHPVASQASDTADEADIPVTVVTVQDPDTADTDTVSAQVTSGLFGSNLASAHPTIEADRHTTTTGCCF